MMRCLPDVSRYKLMGISRRGGKNELAVISVNMVGKSMYNIPKKTGIDRKIYKYKYQVLWDSLVDVKV